MSQQQHKLPPSAYAEMSAERNVEDTREQLLTEAIDLAEYLTLALRDPARTVIPVFGNVTISTFLVAAGDYQRALAAH